MPIVVIGGQSRNLGKTSIVSGLIAAMPEMNWTAYKVTQFGHGVCSTDGKPCGCDTGDHLVAITEERNRVSGTDTARYLAAGATRSLWVRTRQGMLSAAMPRIRAELAKTEFAIFESNSVVRFLRPDVFLSVLDPGVQDFKQSARYFLDRADALLLPEGSSVASASWLNVSSRLVHSKPLFSMRLPMYCTTEIAAFVRDRLLSTQHISGDPRRSILQDERPSASIQDSTPL